MIFRQLFDPESSTYTYLLADEDTKEAVIVDPVLEQVERDLEQVRDLGLSLRFVVDTHVHADHVTAVGTLADRTGAKVVLSERAGVGCADVYVKHGDMIRFGRHALEVRETPGHTGGCISLVMDDRSRVFTGDALLVRGCGRTDFQEGDARALYRSVHEQLFTLPGTTEVYPAHDYKGRTVTSIDEEKRLNPRLGGGKSADEFAAIMADLHLAYPKKIDVAVPANLVCGTPRRLPATFDAQHPAGRGWAPVDTSAGGVPEVAAEWVASHAGALRIVDVREPSEWFGELGHVAGAELVPLANVDVVTRGWDRSAPLVVLCRSGGRSGKAALLLSAAGFERVASMRGGMTEWNAQRLPVVREVASPDTSPRA